MILAAKSRRKELRRQTRNFELQNSVHDCLREYSKKRNISLTALFLPGSSKYIKNLFPHICVIKLLRLEIHFFADE